MSSSFTPPADLWEVNRKLQLDEPLDGPGDPRWVDTEEARGEYNLRSLYRALGVDDTGGGSARTLRNPPGPRVLPVLRMQARGQLDEALRIQTEEALPAFERLGDIRSRAVTLGRIAGMLEARGQLDEALRIRMEEELPVFEQLGDVRARATTHGRIAEILQARGQFDEAVRTYEQRVLPTLDALNLPAKAERVRARIDELREKLG